MEELTSTTSNVSIRGAGNVGAPALRIILPPSLEKKNFE
jgi:hypothetical protein